MTLGTRGAARRSAGNAFGVGASHALAPAEHCAVPADAGPVPESEPAAAGGRPAAAVGLVEGESFGALLAEGRVAFGALGAVEDRTSVIGAAPVGEQNRGIEAGSADRATGAEETAGKGGTALLTTTN